MAKSHTEQFEIGGRRFDCVVVDYGKGVFTLAIEGVMLHVDHLGWTVEDDDGDDEHDEGGADSCFLPQILASWLTRDPTLSVISVTHLHHVIDPTLLVVVNQATSKS